MILFTVFLKNITYKIKLFENKKYLILEVGGEIDNFYAKMPLFKYNFK